MFLKRLSRDYLVAKDPDAPLFYREEGNKKFQDKDYMGAIVLYSKVSHPQLSRRGYFNNLTMRISLKDRALLLNCVANDSYVYNLWIEFEKENLAEFFCYVLKQRIVCIMCPEFHQKTSIPVFLQPLLAIGLLGPLPCLAYVCQLSLNCMPFLSERLMKLLV